MQFGLQLGLKAKAGAKPGLEKFRSTKKDDSFKSILDFTLIHGDVVIMKGETLQDRMLVGHYCVVWYHIH